MKKVILILIIIASFGCDDGNPTPQPCNDFKVFIYEDFTFTPAGSIQNHLFITKEYTIVNGDTVNTHNWEELTKLDTAAFRDNNGVPIKCPDCPEATFKVITEFWKHEVLFPKGSEDHDIEILDEVMEYLQ